MERPTSAANSAVATHKRTTSKAAVESRSPNSAATVITLFVKNCRLLDLDLLPDWPAVTPASLGIQDARTRIRGAEWCLYQLFRIYDTSTTLDKLQPFFPPLEPLQSINLRAALYRCLNELKKNGVLGRETVLRKSMLDDCQGDKFWELCLSFSSILLRKVAIEKKNKTYKPLAEMIGSAESLRKSQRDSMLPLSIVHRAALTKVLTQKEKKRQTFARLYDVLMDKESDLRVRKVQAQDQAGAKRSRSAAPTVAQSVLEKDWVGSNEIRDALKNGDDASGGDGLLTKSFEAVWDSSARGRLFKRDATETGLLEDLENRTRHQKRRLQKWQGFHDRLLSSKNRVTKDSEAAGKGLQLRFDRHQNMTLRDMSDSPQPPSSPVKHERNVSVAKYDEILTAMREELRKKSSTDPGSPTKPVERIRRPSVQRRNMSVDAMIRASPEPHQRSASQTAVPMRPIFGKRVSSRSRSYQQPKVISQRELVPLKSEIFSPLKSERRGSATPSPGGSMLASPIEEPSLGTGIDSVMGSVPERVRHDSDLGLGLSPSQTPSRGSSGANSPRVSWKPNGEQPDSAIELQAKGLHANRNMDGAGRTVRPSLADRTRMSMAFKSTEDTTDLTTETETIHEASPERSDTPVSDESHTPLERRATLQDRARMSMALAPKPAPVLQSKKAPSHARSRTSQFPVNQFETPEKQQPRRSTLTLEVADVAIAGADRAVSPIQRNITPREKLFDEGAEYGSIFKARPKLARSPDLTPCADSGLGSTDSEIHYEDVGGESLLVGR